MEKAFMERRSAQNHIVTPSKDDPEKGLIAKRKASFLGIKVVITSDFLL